MSFNLRNRSFLKELDFTAAELTFLLRLSADLELAKCGGYQRPRLTGTNIAALTFEKTSTRTRTAFEVAAKDQGARGTRLDRGAKALLDSGAITLGEFDTLKARALA